MYKFEVNSYNTYKNSFLYFFDLSCRKKLIIPVITFLNLFPIDIALIIWLCSCSLMILCSVQLIPTSILWVGRYGPQCRHPQEPGNPQQSGKSSSQLAVMATDQA